MKYLMIFLLVLCAAVCDAQLALQGSPPNGDSGESYSYTFSATGGQQPYTFSVNPAPDFLSMNQSTGELAGTLQSPVIGDTYTFTVTVTDNVGSMDSQQFTISVGAGGGNSDSSGNSGGCTAARGSGLRLLLVAALLGAVCVVRQLRRRSMEL